MKFLDRCVVPHLVVTLTLYHGLLQLKVKSNDQILMYSKMSLLRPPNIKTTSLLRPVFVSPKWYFFYHIIFNIKTTSLIRPFLGSPKGGLNIGVLLYCHLSLSDVQAV